jgi:hypothetical protein
MSESHIVSRHYLRRRARAKAHKLNMDSRVFHGEGNVHYKVSLARRGPYRWYVTEVHK